MNIKSAQAPTVIPSSKVSVEKKPVDQSEVETTPQETFTPSEDRVIHLPRTVLTRGAPSVGGGALGLGAALLFGFSGPIALGVAALAGAGAGYGASSDTVVDFVGDKVSGFMEQREAAQAAENMKVQAIKNATPEQIKQHASGLLGEGSWDSKLEDYAALAKIADFMGDVASYRAMPEADKDYIQNSVETVRDLVKNKRWSRSEQGRLMFLTQHAHEFKAGESFLDDPKFLAENLAPPAELKKEALNDNYTAAYGKTAVLKDGVKRVLENSSLDAWNKYSLSQRFSAIPAEFNTFDGMSSVWPKYHEIIVQAAELSK